MTCLPPLLSGKAKSYKTVYKGFVTLDNYSQSNIFMGEVIENTRVFENNNYYVKANNSMVIWYDGALGPRKKKD